MAELLNCIECGLGVGSDASQCPHCNTSYPQGRECGICHKVGKNPEGVETLGGYGIWVHSVCYEKVQHEYQAIQYTCPACKNTESLSIETIVGHPRPYFTDRCPKCGHPLDHRFQADMCKHCRAYLLPIAATFNPTQFYNAHKMCEQAYEAHLKQLREHHGRNSGCLSSILTISFWVLTSIILIMQIL
jgi:hypothetical protein